MTNFPRSREALRAAGYEFQRRTRCRGCGQTIEFYLTPRGKFIPMQVDKDAKTMLPHWEKCPKVADFRREKEMKQEVKVEVKTPVQKELF